MTRSSATLATSSRRSAAGTASRGTSRRRPAVPGRKPLAGAVLMVLIGSFMPWLDTALGSISGAGGPGIWTFYAAIVGLAGVLVPVRWVAMSHAAILAVVATVLPVWQVLHVLNLVGTGGWMPGPGLVLVFGGGVLASHAAVRMVRSPVEQSD